LGDFSQNIWSHWMDAVAFGIKVLAALNLSHLTRLNLQ